LGKCTCLKLSFDKSLSSKDLFFVFFIYLETDDIEEEKRIDLAGEKYFFFLAL